MNPLVSSTGQALNSPITTHPLQGELFWVNPDPFPCKGRRIKKERGFAPL